MSKSTSPPLRLKLPELMTCDAVGCEDGRIKGLFYQQMVCDRCEGAGVLDKATGEAVPADQLIPAMKQVIRKLKSDNRLLRQQLAKLDTRDPADPYPADMTEMHNGTYRMD